jgi:GDPmannose 4,6-dehydratase
MKKKALITGIMGQDGAYLAKFLLSKNYKVYGAYRRNSNYENNRLRKLKIENQIELIDLEINEFNSVNHVINKINPDEIYNLAAMSFVASSFNQPLYTINTNFIAVINILEVIKNSKKKISFYQASTSEMFGNSTKKAINENTKYDPASPYGISKVASHYLVKFYRKAYNLDCCSGILFNHESPLRGEEFVTKKIVNQLCEISNNERKIMYLGNIYAKRDWGFAPDYVIAMWKMLQLKKKDDFVIGSGKSYSIKEFINLTCEYLKLKVKWVGNGKEEKCINISNNKIIIKISKKFYRPLDVNHLKSNPSNAKKILKWSSKTNIKKIIKEMCDDKIASINSIKSID